jgi:hypothetical protein
VSPHRLLMISNQVGPDWYASFGETFKGMVAGGELEAFEQVFPKITTKARGHGESLDELVTAAERFQPTTVLVATPNGFGHEPAWVGRFLATAGDPAVIYFEGDPWGGLGGWGKPIDRDMASWFSAADVVFSVAREPHFSLFRKKGARDVRYIPQTYCSVTLREAERTPPDVEREPEYDVVAIGSNLTRWGRVSRIPGGVKRVKTMRGLQRRPGLRLALYGLGWSGPGVKGPVTYDRQTAVIREGLMSVIWDHFPRHEGYSSDRLPISLLAGRVHVTTAHPRMEWLPGERIGVFQEPTPAAVVERVEALNSGDAGEIMELGLAGHRWVRDRLSHRQAARFMLGAVEPSLLETLPEDPWRTLLNEWPSLPEGVRTGSGG